MVASEIDSVVDTTVVDSVVASDVDSVVDVDSVLASVDSVA